MLWTQCFGLGAADLALRTRCCGLGVAITLEGMVYLVFFDNIESSIFN